MKAVYALLCLTLAQGISGSIFMTSKSRHDDFVQPARDIDQLHHEKHSHSKENLHKNLHHSRYEVSSRSHSDSSSSSASSDSSSQEDYIKPAHKSIHMIKKTPMYSFFMNVKDAYPHHDDDSVVWKNIRMTSEPTPIQAEDVKEMFDDALKISEHFGITEEEKTEFHNEISETQRKYNEDTYYNATELLKKHQYPVEEHTVTTDDGYQLTVLRIPPTHNSRDNQKKPVVLLMHSLLGSADEWLLMGPSKSLAYMLSDAGYDVWLGNVRGNKYSQNHVSKHPALKDFWKFSNDEIAQHDLPAMIDHALEVSGDDKLHYVGHSQGAANFFALMSEQPSYNEKIASMHALSPAVYMKNVRSPLIRMIAPTSKTYKPLHDQFGHGVFHPRKSLIEAFGGSVCQEKLACEHVCDNLKYVMSGINIRNQDPDTVSAVTRHLPDHTSARVIKHLGQNAASHEFRKYDYGADINNKVYGAPEPPSYDLTKVDAPVNLYYSHDDWLSHPNDVEKLREELPNVKESIEVPEQYHFTDMDFQFSKKAPEIVYQKLMENMQNAY